MLGFRLEKIEIKGFKSEETTASLEFYNGQTTTVYGKNGCGKTTLLKIISAIFDKNFKILYDEKVQSVKLQVSEFGEPHTYVLQLETHTIENKVSYDYNWGVIEKLKQGILMITTDRGLSNYRRKLDIKDIYSYIIRKGDDIVLNRESSYSELNDLIDFLNGTASKLNAEDLYCKKNLFLENIRMETIEEMCLDQYNKIEILKSHELKLEIYEIAMEILMDRQDKLESRYKMKEKKNVKNLDINYTELREKLNKYEPLIKEILKTEDNKVEYTLFNLFYKHGKSMLDIDNSGIIYENPDILFIYKLVEILEKNENKLFELENIKNIFNRFTNNSKELIINKDVVQIKVNNSYHKLIELSNGERHLLTFLVVLAFIGKNKNIIMIDEPGISLDTDWQEILVSEIEQLCPDSQIILTTHSPDISINNHKMIRNLKFI